MLSKKQADLSAESNIYSKKLLRRDSGKEVESMEAKVASGQMSKDNM